MTADAGYYQVLTTVESKDDATSLARTLLENRAAACVQILGPIESHYWWQGEIQTEREWLCQIKTAADALDRLMTLIGEHHAYDTPEITATAIVQGSTQYLAWIGEETRAI